MTDGEPTGGARPPQPLAVRLQQQLRAHRAAQLALDGHTWDDIAEECGYASRGSAHRAVERLMQRVPAETVEQYRSVNVRRMELLIEAQMPAALGFELDGTPREKGPSSFAADRVMAAADRIARWTGTDGPPPPDVQAAEQDAVVSPGVGKSLASVLGLDDGDAREVARVLAPILARRKQHAVIEAPDGSPARGDD